MFGKKVVLLAGEKYLPLQLEDIQLQISPRSFFQLNTKQAIQLYRNIAAMIPAKCNLLVEAYSGIGGISMYLKR